MIAAELFANKAANFGFATYTGVPCSYLRGLIDYAIGAHDLRYIGATNEGDAVSIAAGLELGGRRAVVVLQNSGLGNAVSPLTSLTYTFEIPVLLIVTLRGEPNGAADEPQHRLMGRITCQLLDLMEIRWSYFPDREQDLDSALERANASLLRHRRPFAFVVRKGAIHIGNLPGATRREHRNPHRAVPRATATVRRTDVLRRLQECAGGRDIVVATTGYTGRELYALGEGPNQFYVVGAMGCASSVGLGLAIARPDTRVIVIDGDGAALMRLGSMCTIGHEHPANLFHVLIDNGMHESTGGQVTVSGSVDFGALASASGYPVVASVSTPDELSALYEISKGQLTFAHIPILPGTSNELPRPTVAPEQVATRLRRFLREVQ